VGLSGSDGQRFAGKQRVAFTAYRHVGLTRDDLRVSLRPRMKTSRSTVDSRWKITPLH
jgi:hypothetical protein